MDEEETWERSVGQIKHTEIHEAKYRILNLVWNKLEQGEEDMA